MKDDAKPVLIKPPRGAFDAPGHHAFDLEDAFGIEFLSGEEPPCFAAGIAPKSDAFQLMTAVLKGQARRVESLLQSPGALPDFASNCGFTPLMAAAALGEAEIVEMLASHPLVNLSRETTDGWTALHYAAQFGRQDAVAALLSHHAPPEIKTRTGETPFDLARDEKTRDAFRRDRNFRLYMKLHPEYEAVPAAPAAAPLAPEKPERDPLKEAFFRAITGVGLQIKGSRGAQVHEALIDKLSGMKRDEIRQACGAIMMTGAAFDWSSVFIKAAAKGNTEGMRMLHDKFLFEQRTLNLALTAAVAAGDNRSVAHHLAVWGADPSAIYEAQGRAAARSIFDAAFGKARFGMLEELVMWRGDRAAKEAFSDFGKLCDYEPRNYDGARDAISLFWLKSGFRKMRGSKLQEAFKVAVQGNDIKGVMAAYVEARRDRFLRGNVDISPDMGAGALAVALLNERYDFARFLIGEGYRLANAPAALKELLQKQGSEQAKQFAADHMAGRLDVEPVQDIGRRKRSELTVIYSRGYIGGAHYGMF